jgi:preprotein translocase subunit SecA
MAKKSKLRRILDNLNGISIDYHLPSYYPILEKINAQGPDIARKTDAQLGEAFQKHKTGAKSEVAFDENVVTETFALIREAAFRAVGMRPFDVQVLGALAMQAGKLAEMQTGEGKTLTAVMPAALHALSGAGVHVLTFNDYLARRDAKWMGPIYQFLGLSVGFVQEGMSTSDRKKAYLSDVVYLTAKEAGFDFLRDGLCYDADSIVQRPYFYAIVDEADSILIDEARVPLVIAGSIDEKITDSYLMADLARRMEQNVDFKLDDYARNIHLTGRGQDFAEKVLRCENLYDAENLDALTRLHNALHAECLLRRDVDYIVRDGKIELVDEFTGRVADKRRWPDGLQAAIEAKENINIQSKGHILNQITLQHFVGLYPKICGMTATAQSSAEELILFYDLQVAVIPPNVECVRMDKEDKIYATKDAKNKALLNEILSVARTKRPILVGTSSVEESAKLATQLENRGVECNVLNAKHDEHEADIIAEAGALGAVTISTNMAGRGTDIKLGGADELDHDKVVALGGLYVLGTNKHETERIDQQLRGRAGRQGDPGASRYFVSVQDDLMVKYQFVELLPPDYVDEENIDPIEDAFVRKEVARIQRICDGQNLEVKKTLNKYSILLEKQRNILFQQRLDIVSENAAVDFFKEHAPEQTEKLQSVLTGAKFDHLCSMIFLNKIDDVWSQFLAEIADIREGIHLKRLGGQDPFIEFQKMSVPLFDELLAQLDEDVIQFFEMLEIDSGDPDFEALGLKAPSATWTYLVNDNPFKNQLGLQLIGNVSTQVVAGFLGPIMALRLLFRKKK